MKKLIFLLAFTVITLGGVCPALAQCSMCKSQVEASRAEKDDYDVSGLNKGILYMAAVPYLLMGAVGFVWYRRTHAKPVAKK